MIPAAESRERPFVHPDIVRVHEARNFRAGKLNTIRKVINVDTLRFTASNPLKGTGDRDALQRAVLPEKHAKLSASTFIARFQPRLSACDSDRHGLMSNTTSAPSSVPNDKHA
jgi:hypothetical protein